MSLMIEAALRARLGEITSSEALDGETRRNVLKEELQFYVLNLIYHHDLYSNWIMYGGSALRILHRLPRMSVDLDFETDHEVNNDYLEVLKTAIEKHFAGTYGTTGDFLTVKITNNRGVKLKFKVSNDLGLDHSSDQVHVKIDLNHFVMPSPVTERRPVMHGQLSFVILTYNKATLMASKLAAFFLRRTRGVGSETYDEKGRDIYDLLWYMSQHIMPDLDYLRAKGLVVDDLRTLLDMVNKKMAGVSDVNLRQDLLPLFTNGATIENWLKEWRVSYASLADDYKIRTVAEPSSVRVSENSHTDVYQLAYSFATEEGGNFEVSCTLSYEAVKHGKLEIVEPARHHDVKISFERPDLDNERLRSLVGRLLEIIETYLAKTARQVIVERLTTRTVIASDDLSSVRMENLLP
jgi:predicted nucleotidyltransferase component of viral defense system